MKWDEWVVEMESDRKWNEWSQMMESGKDDGRFYFSLSGKYGFDQNWKSVRGLVPDEELKAPSVHVSVCIYVTGCMVAVVGVFCAGLGGCFYHTVSANASENTFHVRSGTELYI